MFTVLLINQKLRLVSGEIEKSDRGTSRGIRTPDLDVRTVLLYPAELWRHGAGRGNRNLISSLENLHTNRYTMPAADILYHMW